MFTAMADSGPAGNAYASTDSPYVLFEQAPLTGEWMLQGAATRTFYQAWVQQAQNGVLPLLGDLDTGAASALLPYLVIHRVCRSDPVTFEMVYAGLECATVLGISREPRVLAPDPDEDNLNDVYARLSDVWRQGHPHFCVKTLGWQGRDLTKYEVLLLPYGEAGADGPVAIFNVMSFSSGFDSKYWLVSGV